MVAEPDSHCVTEFTFKYNLFFLTHSQTKQLYSALCFVTSVKELFFYLNGEILPKRRFYKFYFLRLILKNFVQKKNLYGLYIITLNLGLQCMEKCTTKFNFCMFSYIKFIVTHLFFLQILCMYTQFTHVIHIEIPKQGLCNSTFMAAWK